MQKSGLRLDVSIDRQRKTSVPLTVAASTFKCVDSIAGAFTTRPFDVAIFAMKSFDTAAALEEIKPFSKKYPTDPVFAERG